MKRLFTLEEANALVPLVTAVVARAHQLVSQARSAARRLAHEGVLGDPPGSIPDPELVKDPALRREAEKARLLAETARDEASQLTAAGVVVRDLERGLVDFASIVDGEREVWLCWQLGEREVAFFHELHAGFVGRQPVTGHRFFRSRQLVPPRSEE